MSCAALVSRFFSTNAGAVAFTRTSYSNAYRFRSNAEREKLLRGPRDELADEYVNSHSIRNDDGLVYRYFESMVNVRKCGIGLELYLFSLRYFAAVFCLCSLIAVGPLLLNYQGQFFKEENMDWSVSFGMLGNVQGFGKGMQSSGEQGLEDAKNVYTKLRGILKQEVTYDAMYTFLYTLSILVYAIWTRSKIEKHRARNTTLADFALKLTHIPENRVMAVAEILERKGHEIVEIVPIRHLKRLIHHLKCSKHQAKVEFIRSLKARGKRYTLSQLNMSEKKLKKHEMKVQNLGKKIAPAHSAIFVFRLRRDKYIVQKFFHQSWIANIKNKLRVACAKESEKHEYWFSEINAKLVPTPGDIYWENVRKRRYLRRYGYYVIALLVILLSASAVYSMKDEQNDIGDQNMEACVRKYRDRDYCECLLGTSSSTSCTKNKVKTGFVKVAISIFVVFINSWLPWVLSMISAQEKQSSMPRRKLSTMIKCFFGLLINTAFIILVVNANFQDFRISTVLKMIDSRFKDFSRYWYPEVGFSIFMSMFFGIFSPHLIMSFYYSFKKHCLKCVKNLYDTQITYNYWRIGADIDLPLKTAYQLVIIFSCLMYSGGMPLMLPICSLTMLMMYLCERYLLRHYEKPNEHSTILHTWFLKILPLSIVLHCCFSLYSYGAESIFPYSSPSDWYSSMNVTGCGVKSATITNLMPFSEMTCEGTEVGYASTASNLTLQDASLRECKMMTFGSFSRTKLLSNATLSYLSYVVYRPSVNISRCAVNVTSALIESATLTFNLTQYVLEANNSYAQRAEHFSGVVFLVLSGVALLLGLLIPFLENYLIRLSSLSAGSVYDELARGDFAGGRSYQMITNENYSEAIRRMLAPKRNIVDEEEDVDVLVEEESPLKFLPADSPLTGNQLLQDEDGDS